MFAGMLACVDVGWWAGWGGAKNLGELHLARSTWEVRRVAHGSALVTLWRTLSFPSRWERCSSRQLPSEALGCSTQTGLKNPCGDCNFLSKVYHVSSNKQCRPITCVSTTPWGQTPARFKVTEAIVVLTKETTSQSLSYVLFYLIIGLNITSPPHQAPIAANSFTEDSE